MAGNTAILAVKIVTDSKAATKGFDDLDKSADSAAKKGLAAASVAAAAVGAAMVGLGLQAVDAASKLQQSTGAAQSVFGEFADDVIANSKRAADAVGLSASAYQNMAAILGSQLKNAGTPMDAIAGKTDTLIQLGADLAATYGGDVATAVNAVSSLMRGERDPIEAYGVSINQAAIEAYKAANGLDNLTGAADAQADSQAALALLFEQTGAAQGQFARESDTLAGQQARLQATWEDTLAVLGESLLPLMTTAATVLADVAAWIGENETAFLALVVVLAAAAAAIWAVNIAMYANPVGLIIAAVAALIAIVILLVANWDSVVAAFENGGKQIGAALDAVGKWFQDIFAAIARWWEGLLDSFENGFDQLFGWIDDALGWLGDLMGAQSKAANSKPRAVVAIAPTVSPMLADSSPGLAAFAAGGSAVRSSSGTTPGNQAPVQITINGALDPDAVARQITQLLTRYGRNTGRLVTAGNRGF